MNIFVWKSSKIAAQKKVFFFADFALVLPPMASVLLSASVQRCFVSLMRDFFEWLSLKQYFRQWQVNCWIMVELQFICISVYLLFVFLHYCILHFFISIICISVYLSFVIWYFSMLYFFISVISISLLFQFVFMWHMWMN